MGCCFLVKHTESGKQYVMKQIDLGSMNKKERRQALNEAKLLSSLRHPNIINYVDSFLARRSDHLCIVMEHADAGDVGGRLKAAKGHLRENVVLDWFIQISLALGAMHSKRVLHRDIKSQNIFLTSQGIVKIGDFGIARELNNTFDQAHTFVGTPYYLSPELVQEKPYDSRSDTWALGVVLYELMALKHPFNAADMKSLMTKIIRVQYDPPPSVYSQELRDVVAKILVKDVRQRICLDKVLHLPLVRHRIGQWVSGMAGVPQPYLDRMLQNRLFPSYAYPEQPAPPLPAPQTDREDAETATPQPRRQSRTDTTSLPSTATTTTHTDPPLGAARERRANGSSPAPLAAQGGASPELHDRGDRGGTQPYNVNYPHSLPNVPYPYKPPLLANMNLNQFMGKKPAGASGGAGSGPASGALATQDSSADIRQSKAPSPYPMPSPKMRDDGTAHSTDLRQRELLKERELLGMMGYMRNPHLSRLPAKNAVTNHSPSPNMGEAGGLPRLSSNTALRAQPILNPGGRMPEKQVVPNYPRQSGNYQVPSLPHPQQKRPVLPLPPMPPVQAINR